jgi:hypothetical protein
MGDRNLKKDLGRAPTAHEQAFQKWFADISKKMDLSPDPDDPESYYDYRGFYDALQRGEVKSPTEPGQHWSSQFKSPDHPRMYLEDPMNSRFFNTDSGAYTGGQHEMVPEGRMDVLNKLDIPDLPKTQWNDAKAGANSSDKIKDPWADKPEKKSEIIDPWGAQ